MWIGQWGGKQYSVISNRAWWLNVAIIGNKFWEIAALLWIPKSNLNYGKHFNCGNTFSMLNLILFCLMNKTLDKCFISNFMWHSIVGYDVLRKICQFSGKGICFYWFYKGSLVPVVLLSRQMNNKLHNVLFYFLIAIIFFMNWC